MKTSIKSFAYKYRHAHALVGFFIMVLWFFLIQLVQDGDVHIIYSSLDDYVPFCELFIVPYVIWYIYISAPMLFMMFKSSDDYYKMMRLFFAGIYLCLFFCTVYPNGITLRPEVMPRDNVFCDLVLMIYGADKPQNCFPSMHCYGAVSICCSMLSSKSVKLNLVWKILFILTAVLICMSTAFIKQHSVLDVFAGVLFALVLYAFIYFIIPKFARQLHKKSLNKQHLQK